MLGIKIESLYDNIAHHRTMPGRYDCPAELAFIDLVQVASIANCVASMQW